MKTGPAVLQVAVLMIAGYVIARLGMLDKGLQEVRARVRRLGSSQAHRRLRRTSTSWTQISSRRRSS